MSVHVITEGRRYIALTRLAEDIGGVSLAGLLKRVRKFEAAGEITTHRDMRNLRKVLLDREDADYVRRSYGVAPLSERE